MKTLIIKGKPYTYIPDNLSYATAQPMSLDVAKELLCTTKRLFEGINLPFFLCYGTLLGAVREKSLIKNDEDLDIFIDNENLLYENLQYLKDNGLKLIRIVPHIVYSFRLGSSGYIDVYILHKLKWYNPWSFYCYSLESKIQPKKYFKEYEPIEFLGVSCLCPKNPEKMLAFWYGDDWRTPISGHKFYYEVKSAYYWHYFKNVFLKKILLYDFFIKRIRKSNK